MKRQALWMFTILVLASLGLTGFQCGSPEFTGAKVYINQKNYKEAIRLLEVETDKNPSNEEAWYLLGQLRAETGDMAKMNLAFTKALELNQKHAKEIQNYRFKYWGTHVNAGVSALQRASSDSMQYYDKSIEEFNLASDAWPDTSITYRYLGYAYSGKGDQDAAIAAFRVAWQKGKDTEAFKQVGRIYLDRGKKMKREFESENADKIRALQNLESVEKGMPKGEVMALVGAPEDKKTGGRRSTKETWMYTKYHMEVDIDKDKVVEVRRLMAYNPDIDSTLHATALVQLDSAVNVFEAIKKVDPKDNQNLNLLLDGYVQADRINEAIRGFSQAVENDPGSKTNHYILGVLNRTAGNFDAAIASFRKAIEIDPNFADALFDLGATYYNWGVDMIKKAQEEGKESEEYKAKFEQALPLLEKVTELKKNDPSVWETLGTIYARLGDSKKAMDALDHADKIRKGN